MDVTYVGDEDDEDDDVNCKDCIGVDGLKLPILT